MQRWKLSALAAASLALSSLSATDAWALALGRITVQSALGEPLRAEVEIPQITKAEADTLQATIASPAAFRAQGMEYTGIANSVRVQVQKRANGITVLRLSSSQPVNDPFLDLVIDTNWASGKLQRNYTLLLDPPSSRQAPPAPTTAAQVAPAPVPSAARPAVTARPATTAINTAGRDLRNDRDMDDASSKAQRKQPTTASATTPTTSAGELRIKAGDTAGRIAAANKPEGVSLDQMLVAMLSSNPQAFIGGNINRMRSGAVMQLPDQAAAQATSAKEARQIMAAQSQDFNRFRRQLAGVAPTAPVEAATRSASGQVQAHVDDGKSGTTTPDKLTLSKGAVKGAAADEQLAQKKQAADQSARTDELKRNMAELSQIAAAAKPASTAAAPAAAAAPATPAAAPAAATPAINVPAATAATSAAPAAGTETAATPSTTTAAPSATADNTAPAAPAEAGKTETSPATELSGEAAPVEPEAPAPVPEPVAPPQPATPPAPVPVPEEPGFIDSLMEDPTIPLAGAALLALLLGYGGYRVIQRRKAASAGIVADSTLGDSQLSTDSFFGASGGQRVDTGSNSSQMSAQSMQYSPSQLDAGDVDPLAEADVYLAYGRDLQAEEILKEALRADPNRLILHQKLADIYAKRNDRMAYSAVANNLHALTQGKGPEWQKLADQGRILDPENQLYQPGGFPQSQAATNTATPSAALNGGAGAAMAFGSALASAASREGPPTVPADMNLDPNRRNISAAASPAAAAPAPAANGLNFNLNDLASFSLPATATQAPAPAVAPAPAAQAPINALEFDLDSFTLPLQSKPESTQQSAPSASKQGSAEDHGNTEAMTLQMPIDASSVPTAGAPLQAATGGLTNSAAASEPESPLATKLALAAEFNAIGDSDGARTLIEEVIAEAHGDLKVKAQTLLSQIG